MRTQITGHGVTLWLSASDTADWATRWPCSDLRGKRLRATFDAHGLVELAINGRNADCSADEFNAIASDFLRDVLPEEHPAWFVTVGQFV